MSAPAASRPVGAMRNDVWCGARPSSVVAWRSEPMAPAASHAAAPVGSARRTRTCAVQRHPHDEGEGGTVGGTVRETVGETR
jgi:hypothetical protein